MSGALDALRRGVVKQLQNCGLNAVPAMEPEPAARWRKPVVAVGIRRVVCAPGGFQDYLGVQENGGGLREQYGRELELTLALDIYAPPDGGEGACQDTLTELVEALVCQGAAGLNALEIQANQVEFLEKTGLYRQGVSCRCMAWLAVAQSADGTQFVDFEVRGRRACV